MGIDLNIIKQKLGEVKSQKSQSKFIWKPKTGKQIIRIVPYKFNKDNPFIELYFHYKIAKSMLSPITHGNPDPAVKLSEKLLQKNDKNAYKLAKAIEPKLRVYVPIVERGKEHEGAKFWGIGKTIYEELLEAIADPDWGDISDVTGGNDILVELKEVPGKDYPEPSIRLKPQKTPLAKSKEDLLAIFESQQDINTIFKEPSYDEVQAALDEFIKDYENGDTAKDDGFTAPTKHKPTPKDEFDSMEADFDVPAPSKPSAPATKTEAVDDITDEFEKMYNS